MNTLADLLKSRVPTGGPAPKISPPKSGGVAAPKPSERTCVIHNVIQGTTEWHELRAGIPTASKFDKIITPSGEPSRSREKYMYRLVAERLKGEHFDDFKNFWTDRGSQMEGEAVSFYEFQRELTTVPVGFITNAEGTAGASPDRLVGDIGLLECKCPSPEVHMMYLLQSGSAYEEYRVQVQGQLFIAQRQWSDVLSYFPGLPWALTRIERDDRFIAQMEPLLWEFCDELKALHRRCIAEGWEVEKPQPKVPPRVSQQEELVNAVRDGLSQMNRSKWH